MGCTWNPGYSWPVTSGWFLTLPPLPWRLCIVPLKFFKVILLWIRKLNYTSNSIPHLTTQLQIVSIWSHLLMHLTGSFPKSTWDSLHVCSHVFTCVLSLLALLFAIVDSALSVDWDNTALLVLLHSESPWNSSSVGDLKKWGHTRESKAPPQPPEPLSLRSQPQRTPFPAPGNR